MNAALSNEDLLLAYSEWLDSEGLIVSDSDPAGDKRPHEQLVRDFLAGREKPVLSVVDPEEPVDRDDGVEGFVIEQCGIRQNHPQHQWGAVGGEAKMCEGLS